jgi:ParB family chromosome partitioning protein
LSRSHNREPYYIRRQLTDGAVRASDRRARFVGVEAYEAAGGIVMRDLFQNDEGGWLQDPALLDRLAIEKLQIEAEALQSEGWKWISVAPDFPYGHTAGLRRLVGATVDLTEDERARFDALQAENEALEEQYAEADELPNEIDQRLGEIETALAAFDNRPVTYEQAEITRAGAFVSIDGEGALRIERGFVRPEDEAPALSVTGGESAAPRIAGSDSVVQGTVITVGGAQNSDADTSEEDDAIRPLSDRLVTELTAHRTLALRDALANEPNVAFQAVLHALCLSAFYRHSPNSCLEITAKDSSFSAQAPGLAESASARAIDARHEQWAKRLPENSADLWDALTAFDRENKAALFAHCAALTVNVVKEPWNRRPDAFAHGDQLARAVGLDMAAAGWRPTVENYLGRVPKVRIIEAVREAKGEQPARLIEHLKKADMAREAERLLNGAGWLPEPLRVAQAGMEVDAPTAEVGEAEALPDFLGEDDAQLEAEEEQPYAAAAAE